MTETEACIALNMVPNLGPVRLRKLLEPDPSKPRYIQTVWGLGYVFIPDGQS